MTIIVKCGDKGWIARWQELGVDVPLPFPVDTNFYVVHDHLKAWYPIASIDEIKIEEGGLTAYRPKGRTLRDVRFRTAF